MSARYSKRTLFLLLVLAVPKLWAQGPPYQTDDPVPVDLHHYEFYIFGSTDGTPAEIDSTGPAFEFNWGAIPGCNYTPSFPGEAYSLQTIPFTFLAERVRALLVLTTWNWA